MKSRIYKKIILKFQRVGTFTQVLLWTMLEDTIQCIFARKEMYQDSLMIDMAAPITPNIHTMMINLKFYAMVND